MSLYCEEYLCTGHLDALMKKQRGKKFPIMCWHARVNDITHIQFRCHTPNTKICLWHSQYTDHQHKIHYLDQRRNKDSSHHCECIWCCFTTAQGAECRSFKLFHLFIMAWSSGQWLGQWGEIIWNDTGPYRSCSVSQMLIYLQPIWQPCQCMESMKELLSAKTTSPFKQKGLRRIVNPNGRTLCPTSRDL